MIVICLVFAVFFESIVLEETFATSFALIWKLFTVDYKVSFQKVFAAESSVTVFKGAGITDIFAILAMDR